MYHSERIGKDKTVIIPLKVGTSVMTVIMEFLHPKTFVAYKLIPIHNKHLLGFKKQI